MNVEYRVLGPLEVLRDGVPGTLPTGRGHVLFATLQHLHRAQHPEFDAHGSRRPAGLRQRDPQSVLSSSVAHVGVVLQGGGGDVDHLGVQAERRCRLDDQPPESRICARLRPGMTDFAIPVVRAGRIG